MNNGNHGQGRDALEGLQGMQFVTLNFEKNRAPISPESLRGGGCAPSKTEGDGGGGDLPAIPGVDAPLNPLAVIGCGGYQDGYKGRAQDHHCGIAGTKSEFLDKDCGKFAGRGLWGGAWMDNACATKAPGQLKASTDRDCGIAKVYIGGGYQDNDCSIGGHDNDCNIKTGAIGYNHTDQDCPPTGAKRGQDLSDCFWDIGERPHPAGTEQPEVPSDNPTPDIPQA